MEKIEAGGMGLGAWGLEVKGVRPDCLGLRSLGFRVHSAQ